MKYRLTIIISICAFHFQSLLGQGSENLKFNAGFKTIMLVDSSRVYKIDSEENDPLHYRTIELDVWYPSLERKSHPIKFGELFGLFEKRSSKYGNEDFSGMTEELAVFYLSELGIESSPEVLLDAPTNSFFETKMVDGKLPIVIYMAGFNGMGFENYKVMEKLAQEGVLVVSIWSVGQYPGNMSNKKPDMLEQVFDAEYALNYLRSDSGIPIERDKIGVLGMSWGGMSSAVLVARNPEIKAFVSFDGSEIHYFGDLADVDEKGVSNDSHIQEIFEADLLKPQIQTISYLYLESGDRHKGFFPTSEYSYYESLISDKRYLRFVESSHEDFTSIPSILDTLGAANQIHKDLTDLAFHFFLDKFYDKNLFDEYWSSMVAEKNVSKYKPTNNVNDQNFRADHLEGKVIDSKTKLPLPYVNIGIIEKNLGTVTNEEGMFGLTFSEKELTDTLKISMIGYNSQKFTLSDLMNAKFKGDIALDEKTGTLEEVVVYEKGLDRKVLGNKTESKFISTGFGFDQLGAEMGIRINVRKSPTFLDTLNFHVSHNRLSAKSIFRVNLYKEENGKPGENILKHNILVEINPKQTGLVSVDLIPFDIVLLEDSYVTLEWIKNEGVNEKGEAIFFSLGLFNSGTLYKPSSQAKFQKHSSLGVGFNLVVRQ